MRFAIWHNSPVCRFRRQARRRLTYENARDHGLFAARSEFYRGQLKDSSAAIEYLKRRGVSGQTAARFALGYAPDAWQPLRAAFDNYDDPHLVEAGLVIADEESADRFRGRVMFPIRSARGQVIGLARG